MARNKAINSLIQLILAVLVAIVFVSVIQQVLFLPVGVQGPSMEPTINSSGDTAYVQKRGYTLEVDDIIVFYRPLTPEAEDMDNPAQKPFNLKDFFMNFLHLRNSTQTDIGTAPPEEEVNFICVIKRVVGIPGDVIEIKDEVLYRNGEVIDDFPMAGVKDVEEITIPDGKYFVLGDNRANSYDSEDYGTIGEEYILGKVLMLISRGSGFSVKFV